MSDPRDREREGLPTIAQQILATTSAMKREGTYGNNSLCWSPAELEKLAMYAIDAKYKLLHLNALHPLFGFLRENGGLTEAEERALVALAPIPQSRKRPMTDNRPASPPSPGATP